MEQKPLVLIGYWKGDSAPHWPEPAEFVDATWEERERARVVSYLRRGMLARVYAGFSRRRMCGEAVGGVELSDGVFIWPEGLAHYVEIHGIRPPPRFTEHVRESMRQLQEATIDSTWWLGQPETAPR